MEPEAMILVFWIFSFKPTFSLSSFAFIKRIFSLLHFQGGVICIFEVIDISPGNLDSSLCFIQPSISKHDMLNKQGDNIQPLCTPSQIFPGGSEVIASACNVGVLGSIPGLGRSPGRGRGNPLQYSRLENPMGRGAWWATVHGVTESWTRLSDSARTDILCFWMSFFMYMSKLHHF